MTWVSAGIAVMSLIAAGVLMAARRRRGDGEAHIGRVGIILFSVVLLSAASALVADSSRSDGQQQRVIGRRLPAEPTLVVHRRAGDPLDHHRFRTHGLAAAGRAVA